MVAMTSTLLSTMGSRVVLPEVRRADEQRRDVVRSAPGPAQLDGAGQAAALQHVPDHHARGGCARCSPAGASGGRRIMAAVFQLMSFIADFGMDPEIAADHPRIDVSDPDEATADRRLAPEVLDALRADGALDVVQHTVMPVNFANPNMILQRAGERIGVADAVGPWSAPLAQA